MFGRLATKPSPLLRLRRSLRRPFGERRGGTTAWAVMWTIGFFMIGGVAIDTANAYGYKMRLQMVADSSAMLAAMHIADPETGRAKAVELAAKNMPADTHGQVVRPEDVVYGHTNGNGDFVALPDQSAAIESVRVLAGRDGVRGEVLPTWLVRLAGADSWSVNAAAIATPRYLPIAERVCSAATIVSTGELDIAANNIYETAICMHGDTSVKTSGNDYMPSGMKVSSVDKSYVTLGKLVEGSDSPENIISRWDMETPILDAMDAGLFWDYYNALIGQPTKMYSEPSALVSQTYFGPPLPEYVYMPAPNVWGRSTFHSNYGMPAAWFKTFKFVDGNIKPYDVWLWDGDMKFSGAVTLENVVLIVNGDVKFASGKDSTLKNVFIFANGMVDNAGNRQVGYMSDEFCAHGEYSVTILATEELHLSGTGNSGKLSNAQIEAGESVEGPVKGVFGALLVAGGGAGVKPGGAFHQSGGLYIESRADRTHFPGNMHMRGCDGQLKSFLEAFTLDDPAEEEETPVAAAE